MIASNTVSLNDQVDRSHATWAAKPRALPWFVTRPTTGAIIRFPAMSLLGAAMVVFGISAIGLLALAFLLTTRFPTGLASLPSGVAAH